MDVLISVYIVFHNVLDKDIFVFDIHTYLQSLKFKIKQFRYDQSTYSSLRGGDITILVICYFYKPTPM